MKGTRWTKHEVTVLKLALRRGGVPQAVTALPRRTEDGIRNKMLREGITTSSLSGENHTPMVSTSEVSLILNVSLSAARVFALNSPNRVDRGLFTLVPEVDVQAEVERRAGRLSEPPFGYITPGEVCRRLEAIIGPAKRRDSYVRKVAMRLKWRSLLLWRGDRSRLCYHLDDVADFLVSRTPRRAA